MLGRQVGTNLLRLSRPTRLPIRSVPLQQYNADLALRSFSLSAWQCDTATARKPGRPKKAVGEPSRPVKRAVKRTARAPAEGEAATEKVQAAKKEVAKKKAAKPKAKPAPKKKKALTEKQRAARDKRLDILHGKELKELALSPPPRPTLSARNIFIGEQMGKQQEEVVAAGEAQARATTAVLAAAMKRISEKWANLTPAELEVCFPLKPHLRDTQVQSTHPCS